MQDRPLPRTSAPLSQVGVQIFVGVNFRSVQMVDGLGGGSLVLVGNELRNRTITCHRPSVTLHSCATMSLYVRYVDVQIRTYACLFRVYGDGYQWKMEDSVVIARNTSERNNKELRAS